VKGFAVTRYHASEERMNASFALHLRKVQSSTELAGLFLGQIAAKLLSMLCPEVFNLVTRAWQEA